MTQEFKHLAETPEERTPATEAEAAAMVAKIEEQLRKTEAAEELIKTGLRNDGNFLCVIEKRDKSDPHYRLCDAIERLEKLRFKPKPDVDEATLVTRKMFARMEEVKGHTARSSDYHFGHADKENHFQVARAVIAEALVVPFDVEKAARWIFDNSDGWTEDAKANAQKLAEYALRGKQ